MNINEDKFANKSAEEIVNDILENGETEVGDNIDKNLANIEK